MKNFFYIFICMFLFSCEKDIDIDLLDFKSQVVVNCLFHPDQPWEVAVTHSRSILDNSSTEIYGLEDASVNIIEKDNGVIQRIFNTNHTENGVFLSNFFPEEGKVYELEVAHKLGIAHAIAKVPSDIQIESLDTSYIEIDGRKGLKVDFDIVDNGVEENFYVWDLVLSDVADENSGILPTQEAYLTSADGNIEITTDRQDVQQSKLFMADTKFNGSNYQTSFVSYQILPETQEDPDEELKLHLRILAVSQELFDYMKSVEEFYRSQNITTSSVHPIEIESNVEGGLGIFGAYKQKLIPID